MDLGNEWLKELMRNMFSNRVRAAKQTVEKETNRETETSRPEPSNHCAGNTHSIPPGQQAALVSNGMISKRHAQKCELVLETG